MRQQIISLMPPHRVYVEPFLGSGQIFYAKKPATIGSIVADLDEGLIRAHAARPMPRTEYRVADALELLPSLKLTRQDLVYADPPYPGAALTTPQRRNPYYRHDLTSAQHERLLAVLKALPCNVILSGYDCPLYARELASWYRLDYRIATHAGGRVESAWCNFKPYARLHDTRFVGRDFRERERIKRKRLRWVSRFLAMPPAERNVIAEALREAEASIASGGEGDVVTVEFDATRSITAARGEGAR